MLDHYTPLFDAMLREADPARAARYRPFAADLEPERRLGRMAAPAVASAPRRSLWPALRVPGLAGTASWARTLAARPRAVATEPSCAPGCC